MKIKDEYVRDPSERDEVSFILNNLSLEGRCEIAAEFIEEELERAVAEGRPAQFMCHYQAAMIAVLLRASAQIVEQAGERGLR